MMEEISRSSDAIDSSEIPMISTINTNDSIHENIVHSNIDSSNVISNKPIKKATAIKFDDNDTDDHRIISRKSNVTSDISNIDEIEAKARTELISFLQSKGIDAKNLENYKVNVRKSKQSNQAYNNDNEKQRNSGYLYSYISPDGGILSSKTDVYNSIIDSRKRVNSSSNTNYTVRKESFQKSNEAITNTSFPSKFDNINLIHLGKISKKNTFHNIVQIYPIGYKCEQTLTNLLHFRNSSGIVTLTCEIRDLDGFPEFRITNKSNGDTFLASSEVAVWKKFNPNNVDTDWNPSFFNLQVELLIEGLEGSIDCETYKFHSERGYGTSYSSEKEAKASKMSYLLKSGRERRNQDRQSTKFLSKEDQQKNLEQYNKKMMEEKEMSKKMALLEKELKEKEKEEMKKAKEEQRLQQLKQKELVKNTEVVKKEVNRSNEKISKESSKKNNKLRGQYRREINFEIRKKRVDASNAVIEYYDNEEEYEESNIYVNKSNKKESDVTFSKQNKVINSLNEFISSLPEFNIHEISNVADDKIIENTLMISNTLNLFRNHINIESSIRLDNILNDLSNLSISETISDIKMEEEAEIIMTEQKEEKDLTSERNQSVANIERLQLKLVKSIEQELFNVLDSNDVNNSTESTVKIRYPLNQLTWREIARMRILAYIYSEIDKNKEDSQNAIRGNKTNYFKSNKNVIRNIRYSFTVKAQQRLEGSKKLVSMNEISFLNNHIDPEDRLSSMPFLISYRDNENFKSEPNFLDTCRVYNNEKAIDSSIFFNAEQDVINALIKLSANVSDYSEEYRRCSKVLIKILNISHAKNLIWEIDSSSYPEYYSSLKKPIMLSNVAIHLINKLYGDSNSSIGFLFYKDLKQVMINCITYNTEFTPVVHSAQKLLMVSYRHTERWINSADRPDIEQCDDKHCMLSKELINQSLFDSPVKCGKCSSVFSLHYLTKSVDDPFIILPRKEIFDQSSEDWICPLCLKESIDHLSVVLRPECYNDFSQQPFFISEWGPSGAIPWLLNSSFSNQLRDITHQIPQINDIMNALFLLTDNKSEILPKSLPAVQDNTLTCWSLADRLKVLSSLCLILRTDSKSQEYITKVKADSEKILRMSSKASFREADFISAVKDMCGEEGVSFCRNLLDGIETNATEANAYLQSIITEGRCVVCNGSTFSDDMEEVNEDEIEDQIILCDGCNAEVHMKCLNLVAIPSSEWYCATCNNRIALRESKHSQSFSNIENRRSRDREELLIEEVIDQRIQSNFTIDQSNLLCPYCGFSELELCSPFVISQSKGELLAHTELSNNPTVINNYFPNINESTVKFFFDGQQIDHSPVDFPIFPLLNSTMAEKLLSVYNSTSQAPVFSHEICALQIFQARMNKSRHALRRRRKLIGEKVLSILGIDNTPLGYDSNNNEYWKFPICDDLFIFTNQSVNNDQRLFNQSINRNISVESFENETKQTRVWKRISNINEIKRIVEDLSDELTFEKYLKSNIINNFLMDQEDKKSSDQPTESFLEVIINNNDVGAIEIVEIAENVPIKIKSSSITDFTPTALKLLPDKGKSIQNIYVIDVETAFEDDDADSEFAGDPEAIKSYEYFTFSKARSFFAIALVNKDEQILKNGKKLGLTVIYQIHREGISSPLAYAPLSDIWTDNIYYFSTLSFKKSGRYTISFIVEGSTAGAIKPLIFPVVVKAKTIRCGIPDALSRLNASNVLSGGVYGRQILNDRMSLLSSIAEFQNKDSEIYALKCALLSIYAALPNGSLQLTTEKNDDSDGFFLPIAEALGWNEMLDQTWRGIVYNTISSNELMECTLLLEFYINKTWLRQEQSKLLASLPNYHFAVRCATCPSIALRIFCLDKAIIYDKVVNEQRSRRSAITSSREVKQVETETYHESSRSRSRNKNSQDISYESEVYSGRSKRTAATAASAKIKNINASSDEDGEKRQGRISHSRSNKLVVESGEDEFDENGEDEEEEEANDDDDDEEEDGINKRVDSRPQRNARNKSNYSDYNEPNDRNKSRSSRKRRAARSNKYDDDDDEEDGEEDEDEDDGAEVDDGEDYKHNKRSKISELDYFEEYKKSIPEKIKEFDNLINDIIKSNEILDEATDKKIRYLSILRKFASDYRTELFWTPVPLDLPGYHDLISSPMDFSTIFQKITESNEYCEGNNLFKIDIKLMWDNCMTFNSPQSQIYQYAVEFDQETNRMYNEWIESDNRPINPNIPISC